MKKLLLTLGAGLLSLGSFAEESASNHTVQICETNYTSSSGERNLVRKYTQDGYSAEFVPKNLQNGIVNNYVSSYSDGNIKVYSGGGCKFVVTSATPYYYVSGYSVDAILESTAQATDVALAPQNANSQTLNNSTATTISASNIAQGTEAAIYCSGTNNNGIILGNFTVTLSPMPWAGPNMTTNTENPQYYFIVNERDGGNNRAEARQSITYAYAPASGQLELKLPSEWDAMNDDNKASAKWYFVEDASVTGLVPAVKAVKIYNANKTAALKNPENGTFEDGQTWYIAPNSNGGFSGFVISNNTDFSGNNTSWNNASNTATRIGFWTGNDAGSIWSFTLATAPATAEEIAAFNTHKTEVKGALAQWRTIVGTTDNATITTAINEIDAITLPTNPTSVDVATHIPMIDAKATACYNAFMGEANGRVIYIKNVRRSAANGKYLTAASNNQLSTVGFPVAESSWVITRVGTTNTFKLFNPETNKYIQKQASTGNSAQFTVAATGNNDAIFELKANTDGSNPGTALVQTNAGTGIGINVDTGTSTAVGYGYNDGGSSWTIELAGMTPEQAAAAGGKYVRIRSMRSLHIAGRRANGSLIGVTTVDDNDATPAATMVINNQKSMSLGTIWKLEPTATAGKFHIINVASQFENQNNGNALGIQAAPANIGGSYGKWEFKNGLDITNAESAPTVYTRQYTNGLVIHSSSTNIDTGNSSQTGLSGWNNVNNDWPENGGIYIVEEVGETEYNAYLNAYLAAANSAAAAITDDAGVVEVFENNSLFDAATLVDDIKAVLPSATAVTNILTANTLYTASKDYTRVATDERIDDVLKTANGKHFLMQSRRVKGAYDHPFVTAGFTGTECNLDLNTPAWFEQSLRGVWQFEADENNPGYYYLRHHASGGYIKHPEEANGNIKIADGANQSFKLHYGIASKGFGFSTDGSTTDDDKGIHVCDGDTSNPSVISWKVNANESWFDLTALDAEVTVEHSENTANVITFTFGENYDLTPNEAYANSFKITFVKKDLSAEENNATQRRVAAADGAIRTNFENGELNVTFPQTGDYTMTIPAGFFRQKDTKTVMSAPISYDFTVNGVANGIVEIVGESNNSGDIYDLQGRRLTAPVKGINIIGGRKVLVK